MTTIDYNCEHSLNFMPNFLICQNVANVPCMKTKYVETAIGMSHGHCVTCFVASREDESTPCVFEGGFFKGKPGKSHLIKNGDLDALF